MNNQINFITTFGAILLFSGGAVISASAISAETWHATGAQPLPAGAVMYFATSPCPPGWVEANGGIIDQATYPGLYAAVGARLPDLRGEFVRGLDRQRGVDPGRTLNSGQLDAVRNVNPAVTVVSVGGATPTSSVPVQPFSIGGETHPRNVALLACISK